MRKQGPSHPIVLFIPVAFEALNITTPVRGRRVLYRGLYEINAALTPENTYIEAGRDKPLLKSGILLERPR